MKKIDRILDTNLQIEDERRESGFWGRGESGGARVLGGKYYL